MISSNNCRQLVAGNYDVLLNDDHHPAAYKSVLKGFLEHFKQYEMELESKSDCCGYVREFKKLKEYSKSLKENKSNLIDGELDINQKKNRYKDIIPFGHTRVILSGNPEAKPGVNYINANYIRGPSDSPKAYIACQGPLTSTLNDFWRMIWECNVSVVIMACNEYESGKPKCEIYWPEQLEGSQVYEDIQVRLLRVRQINSDFLIRKFSIKLLEPVSDTCNKITNQFTSTATTNGYCKQQQQVINNNSSQQRPTNDFKSYAASNVHHSQQFGIGIPSNNCSNLINGSTGNSSTSNESINGSIDAHEQPMPIDHHNFMRPNDLSSPPPMIANNEPGGVEVDLNPHHLHRDHNHTQPMQPNNRTVIAERTICQFHYTTWPDHGVPESVHSILELVRLIREVQPIDDRPILVHCSAGCGRTGTICCIDYVWGLMKRAKLDADFSLFKIICDMRQQRMAMVQTLEQYILCHRLVATLFMQQLQLIDDEDDDNGLADEEEDEEEEELSYEDAEVPEMRHEYGDDDEQDLGPVII